MSVLSIAAVMSMAPDQIKYNTNILAHWSYFLILDLSACFI